MGIFLHLVIFMFRWFSQESLWKTIVSSARGDGTVRFQEPQLLMNHVMTQAPEYVKSDIIVNPVSEHCLWGVNRITIIFENTVFIIFVCIRCEYWHAYCWVDHRSWWTVSCWILLSAHDRGRHTMSYIHISGHNWWRSRGRLYRLPSRNVLQHHKSDSWRRTV